MASPESLRAQAVRLFALALGVRETDAELGDLLVARAMALQEQATALEEAIIISQNEFSTQPAAQQQQQMQPQEDDETA